MTKEEVTVIYIYWEKIPFDFELIRQKNSSTDFGLYQIYGHHPAYGENSLLYIGLTADQKFGIRLDQRWEFIESCARPQFILLGRIQIDKNGLPNSIDVNRWKEIIKVAEKILIKSHSPAMNKVENTGLFSGEGKEFANEQFLIINNGEYGQLLPEVSTLRTSYRYWSYEKSLCLDELLSTSPIIETK